MKIVLSLKKKLEKPFDLAMLSQFNHKRPTLEVFNKLESLYGTKKVFFNDFFDVNLFDLDKKKNHFIINGANKLLKNVGFSWEHDLLEVNGTLGDYLGARMKSGLIDVRGNCGNFLGCEMQGGRIQVSKNAGDFVGSPSPSEGNKCGMIGGEIIIQGNAGEYLGQLMRRGLIVVKGDVKNYCCFHMIAGSVVVGGCIGKDYSNFMKRGSLILLTQKVKTSQNFVEASMGCSSFLNFLTRFLWDNYKLRINKNSNVKRYVGDRYNNGIGEIIYFD